MLFLLVAAAVIAGAPLLGAVLVTIASLREDYDQSLAGRPPGPFTAAARWLLRARVGPGPSRPRYRLHLRGVQPGRRRGAAGWTSARPLPGSERTDDDPVVPLPRVAAEDNPERDGLGYDGVHPGSTEHSGMVQRL